MTAAQPNEPLRFTLADGRAGPVQRRSGRPTSRAPLRLDSSAVAESTSVKPIAENRRARHDYHLLDRYEAGLQLTGTEVKSLRDGRVTLGQAYADLRDGEVWLIGAHIDEYAQGNLANHEPDRDRKLLLHRREIDRLRGRVQEQGLTLVPTRLYFKDGKAKIELALARGKQVRDKRRDISSREADRQIERALKARQR